MDSWEEVKELIPDDVDKEKLFESLMQYQSNQDLRSLLADMRTLLNEPNKLELYEFMRPLILMRHQIEYSKRAPPVPGVKLRVVRLQRNQGESLGFAVRGGYEHGVGIFVTEVTKGSQADRQGLRVGDEIVRVNGFTISEAIHDDVLNLIKSREDIILKVTHIGMIPIKEDTSDNVTWQYVESLIEGEEEETSRRGRPRDMKIFIDSTGHASIGCSILSDSRPGASFSGIYVEKVKPGSIADEVGLEAGDQIMEVNETSFQNITWKEAVLALKSSRQLNIVIRKKAGSRLLHKLSRPSSDALDGAVIESTPLKNDTKSAVAASNQTRDLIDKRVSPPPEQAKVPSPDAEERSVRRLRPWAPDVKLDESQIIEQQLNRNPLFKKPVVPPSDELPSPSYSTKSASSSVVSTSVEVHTPSFNVPQTTSHKPVSPKELITSTDSSPLLSQSSALGGAAAMLAERRLHSHTGNTPDLLGPPGDYEWTDSVPANIYKLFSNDSLDGRPLHCLTYKKTADLGVDVEGGSGSPLGGKILVAVVFDDGIAKACGKIRVGDQLMMLNNKKLIDVTIADAERIIHGVSSSPTDRVKLYYCESTLINDEDSVTYF